MAIDERKVLAEDGTVFAAVDVSRGLLPGATVSPDEVIPQDLGSSNRCPLSAVSGSQGLLAVLHCSVGSSAWR